MECHRGRWTKPSTKMLSMFILMKRFAVASLVLFWSRIKRTTESGEGSNLSEWPVLNRLHRAATKSSIVNDNTWSA